MELKSGHKQIEGKIVPKEWEMISLGDIFTFKNGLNKGKEYFGHGTPIVNYMDVYKNSSICTLDLRGRVAVNPQEIKNYEVRKGDVFFTRTSETVEEIGMAAVVLDHPTNTVFSGFVLRARPKNNSLDDAFKAYCFSSEQVRQAIQSKSSYTTRALTNGRLLSSVVIPRPPLSEQRAIAAALSDTDALLSSLDRLIAKKRDIKQGIMQQLLTGKQRLPGFSGEWKSEKFGRLFQFLSTGNNSRSDLSAFGDVGYVHYGDIHTQEAGFLDCAKAVLPSIVHSKVSNLPPLQDGDLVMADASEDYSGIGKSVEVKNVGGRKIVAGLHTLLMRGDKELLADGYKGHLQFLPSVKAAMIRYAVGISVYGISKTNIRRIEISLPSVDEQTAIASVLSDMDAEIDALHQRRDKTRAVKQGMMQELLTGRTRLV